MAAQLEAEKKFFDLTVVHFEPLTSGSGGGVLLGKKEKLANAIRENLESLGEQLAARFDQGKTDALQGPV